MPVILDTLRSRPGYDFVGRDCVTIGLVNNMPDAAFEATERQFLDLIGEAAPEIAVRLRLFSIPELRRPDRMRGELAGRYRAISELWDSALDGLIVTGTEPRAVRLNDEPYWPALTELVDWARENTSSTIWSCLAAHAAVLHADGIERSPLGDKLFGVFDCETSGAHPLTGKSARLRVPHSRYNDLPEAPLAFCGYRVLSRSAMAGVDAFVKEERGPSLFVFFQGHPEYENASLLREYRRDIGRFLRGERPDYPAVPQGYFGEEATALADAFRARAGGGRQTDLAEFPMDRIAGGLKNTWRRTALGLYGNWVGTLKERKADRRAAASVRSRRGSVDKLAPHP